MAYLERPFVNTEPSAYEPVDLTLWIDHQRGTIVCAVKFNVRLVQKSLT